MEQDNAPSPARRRNIAATIKGLLFTLFILAALWVALSYVLTPLLLGDKPQPVQEEALAPTQGYAERIKALEDKVAALEQSTQNPEALAALDKRLNTLEQAPAPAADGSTALAPLDTGELAALRAEIEKLKATDHQSLRSILLLHRLGQAVRSGSPYAQELANMRQLRGESTAIAVLEAESATGIATLAQLQEQFRQSIDSELTPSGEEKSLAANLRSLVKIRKVGADQKGEDDEAIIARAEAKLKEGDIAGALAQIENLTGITAQYFAAWKERATQHLEAQAALLRLESEIGTEAGA